MRILLGVAGALVVALLGWGVAIDRARPLDQTSLFLALHAASLGGAALGAGLARSLSARGVLPPLSVPLAALAGLVAWRLAYFPIMVFSGHVASIGEWVLANTGLPIAVYPVFLLAVLAIHGAVAAAACGVVAPPLPWVRLVLAPAFAVAAVVSFTHLSDLRPLPDTQLRLEAPVPPLRAGEANPYLPALVGPGYLPHQRVMLLAAGLTYETIPPSPWATGVRSVLEGLFLETPFGSTRDRVLEHYLAYHSAHGLIGCRRQADCPLGAAAEAP